MSYEYMLIEAQFLLPGRHQVAVLALLQQQYGLEGRNGISGIETLADVFHHFPGCWAWNVDLDQDRDVIDLDLLYGSSWRLSETTALFEAIAPFVASGSIIRVRGEGGEDGEEWRWEFDGQFVQIIEERKASYEE